MFPMADAAPAAIFKQRNVCGPMNHVDSFMNEKWVIIDDWHLIILGEKHPEIFHSYDVWHGAKNFGKRLTKLAKTKGNAALLPWVTDIVNHFWFCCKESSSYEEFMVSKTQFKLIFGKPH